MDLVDPSIAIHRLRSLHLTGEIGKLLLKGRNANFQFCERHDDISNTVDYTLARAR